MKLVDTCSLRDKRIERKIRAMDKAVDILTSSTTLNKDAFIKVFMLNMELLIDAFKLLEDNTTPPKGLMDYSGQEVIAACNRVGEAKNFDDDSNYVIAVMQELTR